MHYKKPQRRIGIDGSEEEEKTGCAGKHMQVESIIALFKKMFQLGELTCIFTQVRAGNYSTLTRAGYTFIDELCPVLDIMLQMKTNGKDEKLLK